MANNIVNLLNENKLTIATAESYTGGLFCNHITNIPNASLVFKGGIIAYSKQAKKTILKIESTLLEKYGTVSKECGIAMAKQCQELFGSDIGVSFTGNAGPSSIENKPIGEVYITIILEDKIYSHQLNLSGTRKSIKKQSINYAIERIFDIINKV